MRSFEVVARGAAARTPREVPWPPAPGQGEIQIARGSDRRSVVVRAYATSPLRFLTPVNHGHAAWIYASSYGGGLVDGDSVAIDLDVGAGATAFLSTQASTKVYRSFRGTRTVTRARVGAGGLLVIAPDPVVCYAGARYDQAQECAIEDGAALVLVDWVTSGRRAAGERWRFDHYSARTAVCVGDALVLHDRLLLRATHGDLAQRFGRFDVLALVVLAGSGVAAEAAQIVETIAARPLERRPSLLLAAAALRGGGCAVRLAGRSVEQVGEAIARLLSFVPSRLGDNPWSRKW